MSAAEIRGVILDYGEVLCTKPTPDRIARMAGAAGLDITTFSARYFAERDPYDRGDLATTDYWSRVLSRTITNGLVDTLRRWDVEMWSDINPLMIEWLGRVRAAGFKTALLSNMHADMASHARRSFPWLKDLDCVVLSCEARLVKPERGIYERCVEGLGLPPVETLFIDDREPNIRAARDAGLAALRFQNPETLRQDLAAMSFPVLPQVP